MQKRFRSGPFLNFHMSNRTNSYNVYSSTSSWDWVGILPK